MTPLHNTALQLPQQDLERCTHFDTSIEAVTDWVNDLALGNPHKRRLHTCAPPCPSSTASPAAGAAL
jgi:hypothetical protein